MKSDERGTKLIKHDPTNKILFGQWKDNKVVSFISSLGVFSMSTVQRRVGVEKLNFQIPTALKLYMKDKFMGGVDNLDKEKCICGSFTSRAMFRKWYRMGLMGMLDFMAVNGRQAWLMSMVDNKDRFFLTKGYFRISLAKELLLFRDESAVNFELEERLRQSSSLIESGHAIQAIPGKGSKLGCCVCQWEKQFRITLKQKEKEDRTINDDSDVSVQSEEKEHSKLVRHKDLIYYTGKYIVGYSNKNFSLHAHSMTLNSDRYIFQLPYFYDLICFEIAHHLRTLGLWVANPDFRYKSQTTNLKEDMRQKKERKGYFVFTIHPIYVLLRKKYGLALKNRKRGAENIVEAAKDADIREEY